MGSLAEDSAGWRPVPLPLKVLVFLMALWALGSIANLPSLMSNGLPFFGATLFGSGAFIVALFFDFIAPLIFVIGLWQREPWAPVWATVYIGVFVLNGLATFFTSAQQIGVAQILIPCAVSMMFLVIVLWKRRYFMATI